MSVIILLLLALHVVLSSDICYSVNNVCETDVQDKRTIHYSGYDFVGEAHSLVHPRTPVYNDVKHFLKENICKEGTLITGLSKNKSIDIFGSRPDTYTYYGKDGSVMGANQAQTIYLQERVMIHQPIKGIPFQLNYGSTRIFPDIKLVTIWWGHFYSLLKAHSEIQLVPILVPEPNSNPGQLQYTLACSSGTVLVIADPRCTFTTQTEVDPAEADYDDSVIGTQTTVFGGGIERRKCTRRVPMLFSGSVRVTTYPRMATASKVCTPSTYLCATGPPIVRQIHVIKSNTSIHIPSVQESTFTETDQIPFACNCDEDAVAQGLRTRTPCTYTQTTGQIELDKVVQSERHALRQLCNADVTCDNDALEWHSTRECGCKKTSTNFIPQYHNDHGILKDPYGFSFTTPCKSWIPHQAKNTSVVLPPFQRVHACDKNLPSFRRKRSIHQDFCLPLIVAVCFSDSDKGDEGAVTKAALQNITISIETSIQSLADKAKKIQNNLNTASQVFNRYSLRINKIERNIQYIIQNLNAFITSTNRNFDITQMEIETLRIQTTIDKLNFQHLYTFLKALHADRLTKVKQGFIINSDTGCVSVPNQHKLSHFGTLDELYANHTFPALPELRTHTFTFTLAPHLDITKLESPKKKGLNTAVVIAIVVCIIVIAIVLLICVCKFL